MQLSKRNWIPLTVLSVVMLFSVACSDSPTLRFDEGPDDGIEDDPTSPFQRIVGRDLQATVAGTGRPARDPRVSMELLRVPREVKPGQVVVAELEIGIEEGHYLVAPMNTTLGYVSMELTFYQAEGIRVRYGPWPDPVLQSPFVDVVVGEERGDTLLEEPEKVQVYTGTVRVPITLEIPSNYRETNPYLRAVAQFQTFGDTEVARTSALNLQFGFDVE